MSDKGSPQHLFSCERAIIQFTTRTNWKGASTRRASEKEGRQRNTQLLRGTFMATWPRRLHHTRPLPPGLYLFLCSFERLELAHQLELRVPLTVELNLQRIQEEKNLLKISRKLDHA